MKELINRQDVIDLLYKLDEIRLKATGFPLNGFSVLLSETKKIPSATKRDVIEYLKDITDEPQTKCETCKWGDVADEHCEICGIAGVDNYFPLTERSE